MSGPVVAARGTAAIISNGSRINPACKNKARVRVGRRLLIERGVHSAPNHPKRKHKIYHFSSSCRHRKPNLKRALAKPARRCKTVAPVRPIIQHLTLVIYTNDSLSRAYATGSGVGRTREKARFYWGIRWGGGIAGVEKREAICPVRQTLANHDVAIGHIRAMPPERRLYAAVGRKTRPVPPKCGVAAHGSPESGHSARMCPSPSSRPRPPNGASLDYRLITD